MKRFPSQTYFSAAALAVACCVLSSPALFAQSDLTGGDISLSEAVALTLATNPTALAARQQLYQSQSAVRAASAGQRFQLTFNNTDGVNNADVIQPPPSRETFGSMQNSLTVPVPIGPKIADSVRAAKEQLVTADALYRETILALAAKVSEAYYDLLEKRALVTAAEDDLHLSTRELDDAKSRNAAGEIPALDMLQAQVPVASGQAALLQAQTDQEISEEALNDLLGRQLDTPISIVDVPTTVSAPDFTLEEARDKALAASPDVAAADAAVAADDAALAAAKRFSDPALSLSAIDLRSKDATSFSREDTLQASITVPIDDGGLGRAQVAAAAEALAQARLTAESARKAVIVTVSTDFLTVESSAAQVAAAMAARDIAQTTYDKTLLGYTSGLYPLVDTLSAENALSQAKTAAISALYDAAAVRSTLDLAVDGQLLP